MAKIPIIGEKKNPTGPEYRFYHWEIPCENYLKFIEVISSIGNKVLDMQMVGLINNFYFKYNQKKELLHFYCSIPNNNEDQVLPGIKEYITVEPVFESEFEPQNMDEIFITQIKYSSYNSLAIQAIAVAGMLIRIMYESHSEKELSKDKQKVMLDLQTMGAHLAKESYSIFGIKEPQMLFHFSEYMQEYFLRIMEEESIRQTIQ